MDETAWQAVMMIRDTEGGEQPSDSAPSLLHLLNTLSEPAVRDFIWELTMIVRDSHRDTY